MAEERLTKVSAWTMVAIFASIGLIVSIVVLVHVMNNQPPPTPTPAYVSPPSR